MGECMAISDNIVRAGLTKKHKDVETLLSMMEFHDGIVDQFVKAGELVGTNVVRYSPGVSDFCVYEVNGPLPEGLHLEHAAIVVCVSGTFHVDFVDSAQKAGDEAEGSAAVEELDP